MSGASQLSACTVCPTGSLCPSGSTAAQSCPPGYSCPNPTATSFNSGGYYLSAAGQSNPFLTSGSCPLGTYCTAGASYPAVCAVGFYCPNTASASRCPQGYYSTLPGLTFEDCEICPPGLDCWSNYYNYGTFEQVSILPVLLHIATNVLDVIPARLRSFPVLLERIPPIMDT